MLTEHHVPTLRFRGFVQPVLRTFLAVGLLVGWSLATVPADDPPRQLPKDGPWARYGMQSVESQSGEEMESSATVTLCLVGTVIEDGVTYRWLETKVVIHDPPKIAGTQVHKILLPEEDLLESEKPFERVRRAWAQRGDSAAKETQITSGVRSEEFLLWTPGMLKGSEPAKNETKDIDYQQGRFKDSQGRTGEIVHKRRLPNNKEIKRVTKYTVWQHPDLQFGFAEARIVGESFLDAAKIQQFTSVYRLQDVGTDANTELPNNN